MAFVVIQHLEPKHESILPEIIQRNSALKAFQAKNRMPVKPNNIYVIPPNSNISLSNKSLIITTREKNTQGIF